MIRVRFGHPPVDVPMPDLTWAHAWAGWHSRETGEPVEVHGGTGQPTVFRRPAWRDQPESEDHHG